MKIYILYIGVILAFLISNLYVFMQNRRIQSLNEDFKTYVQKSNERIYELLVQKENRELEIIANGMQLNNEIIAIDTIGEIQSLKSYCMGDSNKLVLRYSDLDCDICIDNQLKILNEYTDLIRVQNILLMVGHKILRKSKRKMERNFRKVNIEIVDTNLNNVGLPYFFILTPECRVQNVYIPQKKYPQLTKRYLDLIKDKYF